MLNPKAIDTVATAVAALGAARQPLSKQAIAETIGQALQPIASVEPVPASIDDVLLTPTQAQTVVGLSKSTLAKRRMDGTGPVFLSLSSTKVAYRRSDLIAWVASRERRSTLENKT
jgi:predicted DNA-binding transcriptional regulator AlpA